MVLTMQSAILRFVICLANALIIRDICRRYKDDFEVIAHVDNWWSESESMAIMTDFEKAYEKAIADKILPGYALLAGDKNGQHSCLAQGNNHLTTKQAKSCTLERKVYSHLRKARHALSNSIQYAGSHQ